jgi:hypothetical protein
VQADPNNCGGCGRTCGGATPRCDNGTCAASCTYPRLNCNGQCIDVAHDPRNCGFCGNACARDEVCVSSGGFPGCQAYYSAGPCTTCPCDQTSTAWRCDAFDSFRNPDDCCTYGAETICVDRNPGSPCPTM